MFRVTGLRLENICQYDEYDVEFQPGLTAVVGANGGGKTTLLRALAYALTGLVDGGWGTQKSLQKDGTVTPGFAEARFTDGEHGYAIRRFSTSDVKFADVVTCDGNVVAQRRKAVDAFMAGVFGMSPALFFQVCWGRQGQLAQLLTAPPALVGAFLSQVWDTKQLEKVREKLKVQLDTIATLSPGCRDQLARDESALAALPPGPELDAALADADRAYDDASAALDRLSASLHGAVEPDRKRGLVASRSADVLVLERRLEGSAAVRPESDYAGVTPEKAAANFRELSEHRAGTEAFVARLRAERSVAATRVRACADALVAFGEEHVRTESRLRDAESAERCEVCGGHIADHAAYRDRLCETLTSYATESLYEEDCARRREQLSADMEAATAEVDAADDKIAELEASLRELRRMLDDAQTTSRDLEHYGLVRSLEVARERLKEAESMPAMDDAAYAALERAAETRREAGANRDAALALKQQAEASRALLSEAVENGRRAVAQYEVNRNAREALEQLRDVLSRGRAQKRYLRTRMQALNASLGRYMRLTGMQFSLRLDADALAFVFVSQDGYEHPACHLSGAQQSMSALALQMALFDTMRPATNLYLIDEPAEALDDENKLVMAEMFARMNCMLPSVDGTMLIVTRDRPIMDACGNVLDVTQGR